MEGRKRPLVVVDPGHGGADPGAVNDRLGLREADLNLELAGLFKGLTERAGFDVILTRDRHVFVSLDERVEKSNLAHPDAFLSFHINAAAAESAHGFEVWTSPGQTPADDLATAIFGAMLKVSPTGRTDYDDGDPDKEARFFVLRYTSAPAVLIEFGFISNDEEAGKLDDLDNQLNLVTAVLEGLRAWVKA